MGKIIDINTHRAAKSAKRSFKVPVNAVPETIMGLTINHLLSGGAAEDINLWIDQSEIDEGYVTIYILGNKDKGNGDETNEQ